MVIVALDHVAHCYTYEDGLVIADLLARALRSGTDVALSLHGVNDVPSSFVNGAFVSLLDEFPAELLRRHVRVVDSTRQINALIKARVDSTAPHAGERVFA